MYQEYNNELNHNQNRMNSDLIALRVVTFILTLKAIFIYIFILIVSMQLGKIGSSLASGVDYSLGHDVFLGAFFASLFPFIASYVCAIVSKLRFKVILDTLIIIVHIFLLFI